MIDFGRRGVKIKNIVKYSKLYRNIENIFILFFHTDLALLFEKIFK
jgi:hypothetical protein